MKNRIVRLIIVVIGIVFLFISGSITLLIMSFDGYNSIFRILTAILFGLLIVWLLIWGINKFKTKLLLYILSGIILSYAITMGCLKLRERYIENIPTMNDGEFKLAQYEPFENGTLAVSLDKKSTLNFQDSLPRIDGATALYPLYSAFVQATYPPKKYSWYNSEVTGNTTPEAFERLIHGEVDIIFCAAPSKKQIEYAKKKGKTFNLTPIGREAFVFFVNKKNPVREITSDQIKQIYSGKITNWREVGGRNDDIKAFQRPEGSGSQTMLQRIMGDIPLIQPIQNERVDGMMGIIKNTAEYKNFGNAIGYTFLFFATGMVKNDQIALLKVDGVYPDRTTIADNTYPFVGDFYAITTDTQNKNVTKLIEWILSPQGQELVEKTGYTPINKEAIR